MDQDERKFLWFMIAALSIMVMCLTKGQFDLEDRIRLDHESIIDMSFKMDQADEDTLVYYDTKTHHYEIAK